MEILAYVVAAVCTALLIMDWKQTRQIALHPEKWSEMNPILGKHPKTAKVDIYFSIVVIGMWIAVLAVLRFVSNPDFRMVLLVAFVAVTAFEGFVVWRNKKHGL